ncbi:hypothetical protein M569_15821 [Genlisea aurea]|uniref:CID domain-containing protein n=1 Tax=Genlisea aurea TaxID=192259 RepID=S8BWL3_9LAMI|nr:hypothetical protein M569_15821 [Genlisea aurea]
MDRPPHDYGAPTAYGQQQQPPQQQQSQAYGFHPQQFPPSVHGAPFMASHPSLQQFSYPRPMQQSQHYPHLPPPPHLHQQSPPSYPSHIPLHLVPSPFHAPYESAPTPSPPPSDPELQKRIDKLVEYAVKNGPEFEAVVREREQDNPAYSFLFGGEGHGYYHYKLWISTRPPVPFNSPFPVLHPSNAMMNPVTINAPNAAAGGAPSSGIGTSLLQQSQYPAFYEQQHPHQAPLLGSTTHGRSELNGPSRPLPPDIEMELNGVMSNLTGTKESIKGAKNWFMQRAAPFGPILAEALRDRVFSLDDSERQLHIVYLANDILYESLQRRVNPQELDNEAIGFRPVLGSILARVYHNPQNKEENQLRLQKILQFWASKEVFDQDTMFRLENEMLNGPPPPPSSFPGVHQLASSTPFQWQQPDKPSMIHAMVPDHVDSKQALPTYPPQQFHPPSVAAVGFSTAVAAQSPLPLQNLSSAPAPSKFGEKLLPYPLFPPGLIPGMVRKMQIGSGVPYSPISPLDIPTAIPPSNVSPSEVLDRVSKFFRDIGEVNPSEGPLESSRVGNNDDDDDDDYRFDREAVVRKGGACIPPPPNLSVDSETGTSADGSFDRKSSSGRLGVGASAADVNDSSTQYDDVYSSYRKQRSTNYHSTMNARSSAR